eukprot:COSAG03_NODE_20_length_21605_cov_27.875523_12_plen_79_part_00
MRVQAAVSRTVSQGAAEAIELNPPDLVVALAVAVRARWLWPACGRATGRPCLQTTHSHTRLRGRVVCASQASQATVDG